MSVSSKMTAIADEIRELSGTSGAMGLNAMKTNLSDANDKISEQAELIAQIQAAVDGLPEAGGGQSDLINFTIQYGNSNFPSVLNCQAESGMSLGSWIFSSYNNMTSMSYGSTQNGYQINQNKTIQFIFATGTPTMTINGIYVNAFDAIQPNGVYTALHTFSGDWQ